MATTAFDSTLFLSRYPEFCGVLTGTLEAYFAEATLYLNPTDSSIVQDHGQRAVLLNMVTAHIAALANRDLVGRISSATEGSVTVAADMGAISGTQAWFSQTRYGAAFWAATVKYRSFQYVSGRSYPQNRLAQP